MSGLLFKKIKQNWIALLMSFLSPVIIYFFLMLIAGTEDGEGFSLKASCEFMADGTLVRIMYAMIDYYILGSFQVNVLGADENKKWGYFVASTPKGKEGQMYSNYLIVFMMCGLTYISFYIMETAMGAFVYNVTGESYTFITEITSFMLYVQLFFRAVEFPPLVRFGARIGGHIRVIGLVLIMVGAGVYFLFGPLPADTDTLADAVLGFIEDFMNGLIPDWLFLVQSIFPVIAVGGFILSWFISSRLYLKGVENYDK